MHLSVHGIGSLSRWVEMCLLNLESFCFSFEFISHSPVPSSVACLFGRVLFFVWNSIKTLEMKYYFSLNFFLNGRKFWIWMAAASIYYHPHYLLLLLQLLLLLLLWRRSLHIWIIFFRWNVGCCMSSNSS